MFLCHFILKKHILISEINKKELKLKILNKEINNKTLNKSYKERYFKVVNISEKFKFCEYIDQKYIMFKSAILYLPHVELIDTIEGISYEGQKLSGKKLILCGYLDVSFYIDYDCKCFYIKKDIPLSTFIIVPNDTVIDDIYEIYYSIEDITIINIECDYIFISITIFLEYIN